MATVDLLVGFGCELEPGEVTMTDDRMALIELIEQGADSDLVREMLAFAAARMMELEIEAKTGVPAGARSPARLNHRNGVVKATAFGRVGVVQFAASYPG